MTSWHATCHNNQVRGNMQIQVGGYVPQYVKIIATLCPNESLNAD